MSIETLDEETEQRIADLARSHNVIGLDRKMHARQEQALVALRSRIRELTEKAWIDGQASAISPLKPDISYRTRELGNFIEDPKVGDSVEITRHKR